MKDSRYKYDIIANKIMGMIAGGEYEPGDKLPAEAELTQRFAVSRVTLRESLKKLSMMGIVAIRPGSGTYVEAVTPAVFMKPLLPFLAFKKNNIEEIYSVRALIESGACELAAEQRDDNDIARMNILLDKMEIAMHQGDLVTFTQHDEAFHKAIQKAGKNGILDMIGDLFNQFVASHMPAVNHSAAIIENSHQCHRMIHDAIVHRRGTFAAVLMREHLIKAKVDLLAFMQESAIA